MSNILKRSVIAAAALALALGAPLPSPAQVDLGVSISDGRLRSFYMAVGDHYRVAPRAVVDLRTRHRLADEELPVVYFLAARAQVGPGTILDLRLGKRSWLQIATHFRLSPEIFFVHVGQERVGPPYGNAYGYYRNRGRGGDWGQLALTDREVVDLVNLRFLSEYHGLAPDDIIALRGRGRGFVAIHDEIGRGKGKGPAPKPKGPPGGKPDKAAKGKKK